ncbi:MAG: type II secretion system protein [Phycisphaerales bacterium]|jgi:prepilin-type N-terminal cleavage/methylation domain-containing protein
MRHARGFTLIEVGAVTAVLSVGAAVVMPQFQEARATARQLKDSTQLRGITQACAIWAQNTDERYPVPSRIDRKGVTLPRPADLPADARDLRLDTTGNTLSLLIWNGFIPWNLTVSPAEVGNVEVIKNYQTATPTTAVDPNACLWDPAFRGTPLDHWGGKVPGEVGDASHNSYAQVAYFGARESMWGNTFKATEACWANRGAAYVLRDDQWHPLAGSTFGDGSKTMKIHGPPDSWAGNIAFNDQHVSFVERPDPEMLVWAFAGLEGDGERHLPDNVFHSERDQNRWLIDEQIELVTEHDGRGSVFATGKNGGTGALDQRNAYLRPISTVVPGEGDALKAHVWID